MLEQIFLLLNGLALATGVWMVGSDNPKGWIISSLAETTWIIWVVQTQLWGILPCAVALWAMNLRGWYKHLRPTLPKGSFDLWEDELMAEPGIRALHESR